MKNLVKLALVLVVSVFAFSCNKDSDLPQPDTNQDICKIIIDIEEVEKRELGTLLYKDYYLLTFIDRTEKLIEKDGTILSLSVGDEVCGTQDEFFEWDIEANK